MESTARATGERPVCVVTGATSGIGFAAAAALAARGVRVVVHGRSLEKASAAAERIRAAVPSAEVEIASADLASLDAVRALAADLEARFDRLDALIHNAGLERWERELSRDGHELTLAVNHLAPFLLTRLLVPLLARSAPARVIFVSSLVHQWGTIHWDDLMAERWYAPEPVYYQSKLASALTALELARRLEPLGIRLVLAPPGMTRTDFARDFRGMAATWSRVVGTRFFRDPAEVGEELAELALSERFAELSGAYVDRLVPGYPAPNALAREDQRRMWDRTCALLALPASEPPPREEPPRGRPRPRPPSLAKWARALVTGELLGFGATVLIAWIGVAIGGAPETVAGHAIATLVMTLAGVIEGASLGYFQWRALRSFLPMLGARAWMTPTIVLASFGWLVGMLVPLFLMIAGEVEGAPPEDPGMAATIAFSALFGALIGALFGFAQWLVLRRHAHHAWRWIAGNVLGWALGLPATYAAGALTELDTPAWAIVLLATIAAALMGLGVSLGTWASMRGIEPRALP